MKIFNRIKNLSRRTIVGGVVSLAVIGFGVFAISSAYASNISIPNPAPNCDDNAVIYCGVTDTNQIIGDYDNGVPGHNTAISIQNIYGYFGINSADVDGM